MFIFFFQIECLDYILGYLSQWFGWSGLLSYWVCGLLRLKCMEAIMAQALEFTVAVYTQTYGWKKLLHHHQPVNTQTVDTPLVSLTLSYFGNWSNAHFCKEKCFANFANSHTCVKKHHHHYPLWNIVSLNPSEVTMNHNFPHGEHYVANIQFNPCFGNRNTVHMIWTFPSCPQISFGPQHLLVCDPFGYGVNI